MVTGVNTYVRTSLWKAWDQCQVFSIFYLLRWHLWLSLELINSAGLGKEHTPELYLCVPPQHRHCRHASPAHSFYMGPGDLDLVLMLA